jgi:subtilisin family serine protease
MLLGSVSSVFAGERLLDPDVGLRPRDIAPADLSLSTNDTSVVESSPRGALSFDDLTEFITNMELELTDGVSTPEAAYVFSVANMLTMAMGAVDMDEVSDNEVVSVMVWLQQLPRVLHDIYVAEGMNIASYERLSATAAAARREIRSLMASTILFEYEALFAGFAITAPMSQIRAIADLPGVFAVTRMVYYTLDYVELPIFDPNYEVPGNMEAREFARIGELHAMGLDGTGISVGVIDSGIDPEHPEFAHNLRGGWNFLSQQPVTRATVDGSHGTHVAGTVASGGIMSLGVAPNACLWDAQVFGTAGSGGSAGSEAVVTAAMEAFAGARPETGLPRVDVVNMSLGIRDPGANSAFVSGSFARNNLVLAGVTVVVAAGNSATERNTSQRQPYTTTSSNASLPIAVASSQFGSMANWLYEDSGMSLTVSNSDAILSGIFRSNNFGNTETVEVTFNAANTTGNPGWLEPNYFGTYTRYPLYFVEGLGYEIVWINANLPNPLADTTDAQFNAWIAATEADSMIGKILAFNRGISFNDMLGEALRTGAGGVIMVDRDVRSTVSMTIANMPSRYGVVFQAGVALRQAMLNNLDAYGRIFFNPETNGRSSDSAAFEPANSSSIGPVMENAEIKPDIIAPGDNIFSTAVGGGYTAMGGTSMASPFVAGTAALLIQHLRATGQDYSPAVVKARLMNTADPDLIGPNTALNAGDPRFFFNPNGTEASVFEQGAGFVNVWRAIHEDVWITISDEVYTGHANRSTMQADMASFSFNDVERGDSASLTATVHGLNNFSVAVRYNHNTRYANANLNNDVTVDVAVSGNTFTVTVNVGGNANNNRLHGGNLFEGHIFVTSGEYSYVLPWAVRVPHVEPPVQLPDPGASDQAKITLIADASLSLYSPVIGMSMWFDASNQMYDMFMSDEGVQFGWLNNYALRVPPSAVAGGSVQNFLLIGEQASIVVTPDTYDILSISMQNTSSFIAAGDFRAVNAYEFLAGYEYVFRAVGNPGGNPMIVLYAILPYDGLQAGTSSYAKVTVVHPAGFPIGNVHIATYVDSTNALYDMFWTTWGGSSVNFAWLDANTTVLPEFAVGGAYAAMQSPGQTASTVIEPGVTTILPLWRQSATSLGLFAGDWFGASQHNFEAGWEYILTLGLGGTSVVYTVERVPFDGEGRIPNFNGYARVTLDVPVDLWGDGSGYNMFFDLDGAGGMFNAFPSLVAIENASSARLPADALLMGGRGPAVWPTTSATITIPAGFYDYATFNVGGGVWLPGNVNGLSMTTAFPFEAGMHYTFTVGVVGGEDGLILTVTELIPEINEVSFALTPPRGMVLAQTAVEGNDFTGTIAWSPALTAGRFAWDTAYTANVTLTANPGFVFASGVTVDVPGASNIVNNGTTLTFSVTFVAYARPDSARVIAINDSPMASWGVAEFNLLAFDSTRTASAVLNAGGSVSLVNDFDHFVPENFLDDMMIFRGAEANFNMPAGIYDWIWYTQSAAFGAFIDDFGTVTLAAGSTYIFVLDDNWQVSIFECHHTTYELCEVRSIPATCLEEGLDVFVCILCDYVVMQVVTPALGHEFEFGLGDDNVPFKVCTRECCDYETFVVAIALDASVTVTPGNTNQLHITIEETFCNGYERVLAQTFVIRNNDSGVFTLEYYQVFVNTQGNNQIRELRIVNEINVWVAPFESDFILLPTLPDDECVYEDCDCEIADCEYDECEYSEANYDEQDCGEYESGYDGDDYNICDDYNVDSDSSDDSNEDDYTTDGNDDYNDGSYDYTSDGSDNDSYDYTNDGNDDSYDYTNGGNDDSYDYTNGGSDDSSYDYTNDGNDDSSYDYTSDGNDDSYDYTSDGNDDSSYDYTDDGYTGSGYDYTDDGSYDYSDDEFAYEIAA